MHRERCMGAHARLLPVRRPRATLPCLRVCNLNTAAAEEASSSKTNIYAMKSCGLRALHPPATFPHSALRRKDLCCARAFMGPLPLFSCCETLRAQTDSRGAVCVVPRCLFPVALSSFCTPTWPHSPISFFRAVQRVHRSASLRAVLHGALPALPPDYVTEG